MRLLTPDGYDGRIVLSMVVDTTGHVQSGSLSVEESTDADLSAWGCTVALHLRFTPASAKDTPVTALVELPLSYHVGRPPERR